MSKYLVIVESQSKAKTISKILSNDYAVIASYGHIMDLPKNKIGIDPNDNFKPEYSITPDKKRVVADIKKHLYKDTFVYLSPDDDREGTVIATHLVEALKLPKDRYKRVVFHEITKPAIINAIDNPVELDYNIADAGMSRRILDRIVGYKLSPLLWKKIKFGLSAGRVQSVAVRIVADREDEIKAFIPDEFWKLKLEILSNPNFKAELAKHNGKNIKVTNEEQATSIKNYCDGSDYVLSDVEEKDSYRNPPPPFTTSTLQQEASTKAGLSPKLTMMIAQKLYDGSISIPKHTGGLITYMRTDSINLSTLATSQAKDVINVEYGSEYTLPTPRTYSAKGNAKVAAQEAHEAIRPVDLSIKPSDITKYLDDKELKLYTLIWQRTIATQMKQALVANTTYKIHGGEDRSYEFIAKGTKIIFPGFMKAYTEGSEDPDTALDNREKFLPNVEAGTIFNKTTLTTEQNFTKPPPRYTEASLIKKMEVEGIGRPSTYATTLSTISARGYVEINAEKKLVPTTMGMVVTKYLKENFANIVDLAFTANLETKLDMIASGDVKWQDVIREFYVDFDKNINDRTGGDRVQYSDARVIGIDPVSGKDIVVKTGQHGTYLQIGETDKEKGVKAKISPLPKHITSDSITLEEAIKYSAIPKTLGVDDNGVDIVASVGKFGPYVQVGKSYYSIKADNGYTAYDMTLEQAKELIKTIDEAKAKALLLSFDKDDIKILVGRYGVYIKMGKLNYKLPKGTSNEVASKLTLEEVKDIISKQNPSGKKHKVKKHNE